MGQRGERVVKVKITRPGFRLTVEGETYNVDSPPFEVSEGVHSQYERMLEASGFNSTVVELDEAPVELEESEEE